MTVKSFFKSLLSEINPTNLNKVMDTFSKGMTEFSESMEKMNKELRGSQSNSKQDNESNVEKLLGKKKPLW